MAPTPIIVSCKKAPHVLVLTAGYAGKMASSPTGGERRRVRHSGSGLHARGACATTPPSVPCVPRPRRLRLGGVRLPPASASGADVTADAACPRAPKIVDR